jgi:hypothetical protein
MNDSRPEGFLRRWSSRKSDARQGKSPLPEPARVLPPAPASVSQAPLDQLAKHETDTVPVPTLDDVGQLTPASDFSAFVRQEVPAAVKNAAMKKLFADPHFNVMDGLDVYIDDYSLPDPLSPATLSQMASAQFLNLVDAHHEDEPTTVASGTTDESGGQSVAQYEACRPSSESLDHDHADLRLQPDPNAGPEDTGSEPV